MRLNEIKFLLFARKSTLNSPGIYNVVRFDYTNSCMCAGIAQSLRPKSNCDRKEIIHSLGKSEVQILNKDKFIVLR